MTQEEQTAQDPTLTPMDEKSLANFYKVPRTYRKDVLKLKNRLCRVAGKRFQLPWFVNKELCPAEVEWLLKMGSFIKGSPARLLLGRPNECHANSRKLASRSYKYSHYRGLALSDDGIWRLHSWVMSPEGIIETTVKRVMYYGVPLPR